MRSFAARGLALSVCASVAACSLLVDTGGLTSGGGEGSGEAGVPPPGSGEGGVPPGTPPASDGGGAAADAHAPLDYRANVLADGPVAYYRLQDTSGTIAKDETGAHDGSFVGPYTLGQPGPGSGTLSVRFASYARVVADGVAKLPAGTYASYTVEAFVSSEVPAGASAFVWDFQNAASSGGPNMWIDDDTRALKVNVHGATYASANAFTTTAWHHVAMTYASGTGTLYVDGTQDGTWAVSSPAPDRTTFLIGCTETPGDGGPGLTNPFTGRLAEVAIYAKALPLERVAAHWAARP